MNRKLKTALRHRFNYQTEQGFALPIAIGMGLIMVLVGTTMIVTSQRDPVNASAQKATGASLDVAEAGVARVQALMNSARPITTRNLANWPTAAKPYSDTTLPSGCASTRKSSIDVTPYVDENGNGKWVAVDNGQFRIRSYTYNAGTRIGTLKMEGQASRNGQTLAQAPVEVKIPVRTTASIPVPGLWVRRIPSIGNNLIDGNVQITGCKNASGGIVSNVGGSTVASTISSKNYTGQLVINPYEKFPSLPNLPANTCPNQTVKSAAGTAGNNCYYNIDALTGSTVPNSTQARLPRTGCVSLNSKNQCTAEGIIDSKAADGNYYYLVNNNESQGSATQLSIDSPTLTIDTSNGKVILFLKGNIDMRGSAVITHSGTAANFRIYGSNGTANYYCPSSSLCTTSTIQFAGSAALGNAFVYAPSATAAANGCGSNGCLRGSLWVNSWDSSSSSSNTVVTQTLTWAELVGLTSPQPIEPISEWQREAL